jgi:hypothetical protein
MSCTVRPTIVGHEQTSKLTMKAIAREGTWLYDGQIPTGVRVVQCNVRYGTGDRQDPPEICNDSLVAGFDVQWASPVSPSTYPVHASAVFPTLAEAVAYAEGTAWAAGSLKWSQGVE